VGGAETSVLGCQSARGGVFHAVRQAQQCKTGQAFELPMGRRDVADYLVSPLKPFAAAERFQSDGLIETPKQHEVIIHNISALRTIAQGDSEH
jgi:hypothetical protein